MIKISVVIITLNEEKNIGRCLESVKDISDEIVVVDSKSTDKTVQIAKQHGARVIDQAFLGYGAQKKFADAQARYDWILSLDADELLSDQLKLNITNIRSNPKYNAYCFARLTNYCGAWIRHCGWYPDKKTRLFDRTKGEWIGDKIHEHWELHNTKEPIGKLKGDLLHYSYYTITDHLTQIEKFTDLSAREAVEKGKEGSLLKIVLGPKWLFFTQFIIRLGFLDGYAGFLVCRFSAYATFIKHTRIRQYAQIKKQGKSF